MASWRCKSSYLHSTTRWRISLQPVTNAICTFKLSCYSGGSHVDRIFCAGYSIRCGDTAPADLSARGQRDKDSSHDARGATGCVQLFNRDTNYAAGGWLLHGDPVAEYDIFVENYLAGDGDVRMHPSFIDEVMVFDV